ncbi:MAG: T9SS type A sorting domain-containing protein, partial [Bacteroidetes bacterium]|nr:T9SS type A sorting domain-containing protein [Bacteroidota bacterium]
DKAAIVSLEIYDATGRLIEARNEGNKPAGVNSMIINGNNYTPGLYFFVLKAGDYSAIKKMSIIK